MGQRGDQDEAGFSREVDLRRQFREERDREDERSTWGREDVIRDLKRATVPEDRDEPPAEE
jgi:hypothetical protein